jgi:hypothetical protein
MAQLHKTNSQNRAFSNYEQTACPNSQFSIGAKSAFANARYDATLVKLRSSAVV